MYCVLEILLNKVISNKIKLTKKKYFTVGYTQKKKVQKQSWVVPFSKGTLLYILGTDIYTLDTNIYS